MLVDLQSKRYFQLNETAMVIWRSLERKLEIAAIVEELVASYDVTPQAAAESVDRTLRELRARALLA